MSYIINDKLFTDNPLLDELVYHSRQIMSGVILKDLEEANSKETVESIDNGEIYVSILSGNQRFTMFKYDEDILTQFGKFDSEQIKRYAIDNSLIPMEYREDLTQLAVDNFLESFEETNNYYRRLNGLPDYLTPYYFVEEDMVEEDYRPIFDFSIPISEYNEYQIQILDSLGVLDEIKQENPTLKYLNFLGERRIPIYNARKALRFELIYCPKVEEQVSNRFKEILEINRIIFTKRHYSQAYKFESRYYDKFLIIMIICQSVYDLIVEEPEWLIRKDIFDIRTIQLILESNGIEFFQQIPLKYQVSIVRNINKLIKYKSCNKNIDDLSEIFNLKDADIFKYYLMKRKLVDDNGNYKYTEITETTSDGEIITKEDVSADYELMFIKAPIDETIDNYLKDGIYKTTYDSITTEDPYWDGVDTHEFIYNSILNKDFTYQSTKYLSFEANYSYKDYAFKIEYFMNLLFNNVIDTSLLTLKLPVINTTTDFKLFDVFVFLYVVSFHYYSPATPDVIPIKNPSEEIEHDLIYGPLFGDNNDIYMTYTDSEGSTVKVDPNLPHAALFYAGLKTGNTISFYYIGGAAGLTPTKCDEYTLEYIENLYCNIPLFESMDCLNQYFKNGDLNGCINILDISIKSNADGLYPYTKEGYLYNANGGPSAISRFRAMYINMNGGPADWGWGSYVDPFDKEDPRYKVDPSKWFEEKYIDIYKEKLPYINMLRSESNVRVNGFNITANLDKLQKILDLCVGLAPKFAYTKGWNLEDFTSRYYLLQDDGSYKEVTYIPKNADMDKYRIDYKKGVDQFMSFPNGGGYSDIDKLIEIYENNAEIYDNLVDMMDRCNDFDEFKVYSFVFDYLFTMQVDQGKFKKEDGTLYETYSDYLRTNSISLYKFYKDMTQTIDIQSQFNIANNLDQVIQSITEYFDTDILNEIFNFVPSNSRSTILYYLSLYINFFKSYKTQMTDVVASLNYNDKLGNKCHILDRSAFKASLHDFIELNRISPFYKLGTNLSNFINPDIGYPSDAGVIIDFYDSRYFDLDGGPPTDMVSYTNIDSLYPESYNWDQADINLDGATPVDITEGSDIGYAINYTWDGTSASYLEKTLDLDGGPALDALYYQEYCVNGDMIYITDTVIFREDENYVMTAEARVSDEDGNTFIVNDDGLYVYGNFSYIDDLVQLEDESGVVISDLLTAVSNITAAIEPLTESINVASNEVESISEQINNINDPDNGILAEATQYTDEKTSWEIFS